MVWSCTTRSAVKYLITSCGHGIERPARLSSGNLRGLREASRLEGLRHVRRGRTPASQLGEAGTRPAKGRLQMLERIANLQL